MPSVTASSLPGMAAAFNGGVVASSVWYRMTLVGALCALATTANAGFELQDYQPSGGTLQQTFLTNTASGRQISTTQTLSPATIPYSDTQSVVAQSVGDWPIGYSATNYTLGPSLLRADVTHLDRAGPSDAGLFGAWLFSVTDRFTVQATGFLSLASGESITYNTLRAALYDLTSEQLLFESWQEEQANQATYMLGGLDASIKASMIGSLTNELLPGHIYRFNYAMFVDTREAGADASTATGLLELRALNVPEPGALSLVIAAFVVGVTVRRRRGRT